jgi:hypothetical protein
MDGDRGVDRLLFGLLVVALAGAPLAGCGSVGEVGYGASRAGVDPVRSTTGFSSSPYAAVGSKQQAERMKSVAKANQQTQKQTALLNKVEALEDVAGEAVAQAPTEEQATLDPQLKAVVVGLETKVAASQFEADEYPEY